MGVRFCGVIAGFRLVECHTCRACSVFLSIFLYIYIAFFVCILVYVILGVILWIVMMCVLFIVYLEYKLVSECFPFFFYCTLYVYFINKFMLF